MQLASCKSQLYSVPLDELSIPQARLNIDRKTRSNLFPWSGQFSPQLVHVLLETFGQTECRVVDPFMGSGTVLVEAARIGISGIGVEINPAAFQMAQVYCFVNIAQAERVRILATATRLLDNSLPETLSFNATSDVSQSELQERLCSLFYECREPMCRHLFAALIVLIDFFKPGLTVARIFQTWTKLKRTVEELPHSRAPIEVANCDARELPIPTGHVDLVLTSPPYINVFNYHQQYRQSAEALGYDLLHVARSEIGSNRKHRQNRALTVVQYCVDMADAIAELKRVCKKTARLIMVLGRESKVRKASFYNAEIIASLATRCAGMTIERRQERVFRNRFGDSIYEDILHFRPGADHNKASVSPRQVAIESLGEALHFAPPESRADIQEAIERAGAVRGSPTYAPQVSAIRRAKRI